MRRNFFHYRLFWSLCFFLISFRCHCLPDSSHPSKVTRIIPKVISKIHHPLPAFTQGLAFAQDALYESCGLYGRSFIRQLDVNTGTPIRSITIDPWLFAEGIAVLDDRILLLTWKEHKILVIDPLEFKVLNTFFFKNEGWGMCLDNPFVWTSDGSSNLIKRDSKNFEVISVLSVTLNGRPLSGLNDLECNEKYLFANIFLSNYIAQIDKKNGLVIALIDASSLLTQEEKSRLGPEDVLNGIAYRSSTHTFYITGKNWPWIFEVMLDYTETS